MDPRSDGADMARQQVPGSTILHSFGGPDGAGPLLGVIADVNGALDGTTVFGGKAGHGTVFRLTPTKSGYSEAELYSFSGGSDSYGPNGLGRGQKWRPVRCHDCRGKRWLRCGMWHGISTDAQEIRLQIQRALSFPPRPRREPTAGARRCSARTDLSMALPSSGGSSNFGAVFKLTPTKSGYTGERALQLSRGRGGHVASGGTHNRPRGKPLRDDDVRRQCRYCDCGTVFKLTRSGPGYTESVLYSFLGEPDGESPFAALRVDDRTGAIYGTTQYGDTDFYGTVFKLTPSGSGYTESIIYQFNGSSDGAYPEAQLLLRTDGVLFGTTARGAG